ncbi:MAG: condensation domain-containing protein, partial [Acidobacteria bacterium]|nr:condensation domain-containing protein [Acidobacteriota bacterium]
MVPKTFPLSFQQQGIWLLSQLQITNANWNLAGIKIFSGQLLIDLMPQVIEELLKRHEILRTVINLVDFEPVQQVLEIADIEIQDIFSYLDLCTLPKEERENTAYDRYKKDTITTRFDLSRGPLFKIKVIQVQDNKLLIYLLMNHVVADNQSLGIIWHDMEEI